MHTLYIPAFDLSVAPIQRHGGVRRTEQISSAIVYSSRLYVGRRVTLGLEDFLNFINGFLFGFCGAGLKSYVFSSIVVGRLVRHLKAAKLNKDSCQVCFEMLAGTQLYLGDYLRRRGFSYHVLPHNIEFLVPGQYNYGSSSGFRSAQKEMLLYRSAQKITVISKYDMSIVSVFNHNVNILPYFPPASDTANFESISTARALKEPSGKILCLGTAHNPPTRAGIEAVINQFSELSSNELTLLVAGFGTEVFGPLANSNIDVLGALDSEVLNKLLQEIDFALIYQPPTTGFLTKLVELNLCSVPVLVNASYIQSAGLTDYGIYTYENLMDVDFTLARRVEKKFVPSLLCGSF